MGKCGEELEQKPGKAGLLGLLILSELSYAAQTHPPRHGAAYGALGPLMSIISQDNLMDMTTGQSRQVFN